MAADILYIFFVDFLSGVGDDGVRGMIVRFYGLGLSVLAIMIELDVKSAVTLFPGFKGFIPRALLLLLIAVITNVSYATKGSSSSSSSSSSDSSSYGYRFLADQYYANGDDQVADDQVDDGSSYYSNGNNSSGKEYYTTNNGSKIYVDDDDYGFFNPAQIENVPTSAVIFQMVTSWIL